MRIGSLFTGIGGLDWPFIGEDHRWLSEIDPDAGTVLKARFPGIPNLGDIRSIDFKEAEPIDTLIGGGFPCQPFSNAGRKKGSRDDRYLWPEIARAIGELRPSLVLLENVPGLLRMPEWGTVVGSLAALGYDCRWTLIRASDVGAPHQRARLFALAHPNEPRREGTAQDRWPGSADGNLPPTDPERLGWAEGPGPGPGGSRGVGGNGSSDNGGKIATDSERSRWDRREDPQGRDDLTDRDEGGRDQGAGFAAGRADDPETSANPDRDERDRLKTIDGPQGGVEVEPGDDLDRRGDPARWGPYASAIARWERLVGPAPAPTDGRRLNPRFVEWMMGFPPGWVTDLVPRRAALRLLGNAVVPRQLRAALDELSR